MLRQKNLKMESLPLKKSFFLVNFLKKKKIQVLLKKILNPPTLRTLRTLRKFF